MKRQPTSSDEETRDEEETRDTKKQAREGLELEISVRTTYEGLLQPEHLKGFVELKVLSRPPLRRMTYIVVLDKSSSMCTGTRFENTVQGFRALNTLLGLEPRNEERHMAVIPFNDAVRDAFGPMPAPFAPELVHMICNEYLRPDGGTNICEALTKAYDMADQAVSGGGAATILLLTDGEDDDTMQRVARFRPKPAYVPCTYKPSVLNTMSEQRSGIFLCLVGICHDADAKLLGALAELGNGTYTNTKDTDIAGLIGSLVALVGERVHHKVLLDMMVHSGDDAPVEIFKDRVVHLSTSAPTRLPFAVKHSLACASVELRGQARVVGFGALPGRIIQSAPRVLAKEAAVTGEPDVDCVIMDFERISLDHQARMARAIAGGDWDDAEKLNQEAREAFEGLRLEYIETVLERPDARAAAAKVEAELLQGGQDVKAAKTDRAAARELSHRVASDASTARNSGMSIGAGRHESSAQASMRSFSASLSY